nr:sporulation integral membrane protein YtvI [Lachnospiraceae bacterium]
MKQSIKTYVKVILNLITALVILFLCIFLLPKCIFFFMPFVIGWIIALIASPVVRFFEEKLKVRRKGASVIV